MRSRLRPYSDATDQEAHPASMQMLVQVLMNEEVLEPEEYWSPERALGDHDKLISK